MSPQCGHAPYDQLRTEERQKSRNIRKDHKNPNYFVATKFQNSWDERSGEISVLSNTAVYDD